MRWFVYNTRGVCVGKINGQDRRETLEKAKEKFPNVETLLTYAENEQLRLKLGQPGDGDT